MKKKILLVFLTLVMALSAALALVACKPDEPSEKPCTQHVDVDPKDGKCDVCGATMPEEEPPAEASAPVIKVVPAEMEITRGTSEEEIDFLFGVTVEDKYDKDLRAIVSDDGGFDAEVEGEYTVTYTATNSKNKSASATRKYTVVAPPPSLILQVQKENDAANWVDKYGHTSALMTFPNEEYYEIDKDTAYTESKKGVFHNKSTSPIIVSVPGSHGQAAVLNSAGAVVEARDGSNGRLVNKDHPVRLSSTVTTLPQEWFEEPADGGTLNYTVVFNYAFHMEIPAGGYAIVVPHVSTGNFDADGSGWLNKNVVYQYGAAVKLYFEDEPEKLLCTYTDQAPVFLSAENVIVHQDDGTTQQDAEAQLLEEVSYVDDNGTWEIEDDVKSGLIVSIVTSPTNVYDNSALGTYTYLLKIVDQNGNETEFNRSVVVREVDPVMPTISIGGKWFEFAEDRIAVNPKTVANVEAYDVIIYNSYFKGEYVINNYAPYFIVDKNGTVVLTYHPVNGKYYEMGDDDTIRETAKDNTNVLNGVEVPEGGYVVLAVYNNSFNNDMRAAIANSDRMLGKSVELYLFSVLPTFTATPDSGAAKSYSGQKVYVDRADLTPTEFSNAAFLVYTTAFEGTLTNDTNCNAYGIAIVIDSESGKIVRIFDENGYFYDEDHYWAATGPAGGDRISGSSDALDAKYHFTPSNFAQVAVSTLEEGEICVIFPNHASNQAGDPRPFGDGLRQDFKKYTVTFSNFDILAGGGDTEPTDKQQVKIGAATLDVTDVAVNVDNAVTANYEVLIFTHEFTGTYKNGYGYAAVVKDGKIVRVYDGFSGKYFDADNSGGIKDDSKCTATGYAAEAIASLQEGEYVIIFPNLGKGGNDVRTWGGNNARTIGATVELVNISLD